MVKWRGRRKGNKEKWEDTKKIREIRSRQWKRGRMEEWERIQYKLFNKFKIYKFHIQCSYDRGNELSGSVKCWKILTQLAASQGLH
jgi:hypothetical protein